MYKQRHENMVREATDRMGVIRPAQKEFFRFRLSECVPFESTNRGGGLFEVAAGKVVDE